MELRHLRAFVAVAERLNFTRAAANLGIAQPALSLLIKQLEDDFGGKLFERNAGRVALTELGQLTLPEARTTLSNAASVLDLAMGVKKGTRGRIRLGAFSSAVYSIVPAFLRAFRAECPEVVVDVQDMTMHQLFLAIERADIDVAIARTFRIPEGCESILLRKEKLCLAVPADRRLLGDRSQAKALLRGVHIELSSEFSPEFHSTVSGFLSMLDIQPENVQTVKNIHLLLGFVAAGIGVAVVPESLAALGAKAVEFVSFDEETPHLEVRLIWRDASVSPALRRFLGVVPRLNDRDETPGAPR